LDTDLRVKTTLSPKPGKPLSIKRGMPAIGWCMARANDYFQRFPDSSFEEQEVAAAADLLDWQHEFHFAKLGRT
jgi:hypothetical protein